VCSWHIFCAPILVGLKFGLKNNKNLQARTSNPSVDYLYSTAKMWEDEALQANFGDDPGHEAPFPAIIKI
jgi:hypothetical protein